MSARAYKGSFPADQKFRGQAALIVGALNVAIEPQTVKQLAETIKGNLQTRQDPERVVAFYMSVWLKKAWVSYTTVEGAESGATGEPANVHEEAGAVDADTNTAAQVESAVEAAHAAKLQPKLQSGMKLSEMVAEILRVASEHPTLSKLMDAADIVKVLGENGFDLKANQVQSALQNLVRKGVVKEVGELYEHVVAAA